MGRRPARPRDGHLLIVRLNGEILLSGQGVNSQFPGSREDAGEGRYGPDRGQPGPQIGIIQKGLNREIILSRQGVNSQFLGEGGRGRGEGGGGTMREPDETHK